MFFWTLLCAKKHCHAGTGLLDLVKGNYNCEFEEESHLGVMVSCPNVFDNIVYRIKHLNQYQLINIDFTGTEQH